MKRFIPFLFISILTLIEVQAQCVEGDCQDGYGVLNTQSEIYKGEFKNGKMNGKGKYIWPNGNYLEGIFVDDYLEGLGYSYYASDSTLYKGMFHKDKLQDGHVEVFRNGDTVYVGDMVNSKYNGKGKIFLPNGDIYQGDWKNDKMDGNGTYFYKNGNYYTGGFRDNLFHGKGKCLNGSVLYDGDWVNDVIDGDGIYIYQNGDKYEGGCYKWMKHGRGTLTYKSGGKMIGQWELDVFVTGNEIDKYQTSVVFLEHSESGIYFIPVKLNDKIEINMILDTGASELFLTPDIVLTLIRTGTLTEDDILEGGTFTDANGDLNYHVRFNIKSVKIGDFTFDNVSAAIANQVMASNLLGQNVLNQLKRFTFDYVTATMILYR